MTHTDTTSTLTRRAGAFFSGTSLSRGTGLIRDLLMAYAFGTGSAVAAFFVAYRLAYLLRRVLGEGAMQPAFIPTFEGLRQNDADEAAAFFRGLRNVLSLVLLALVVVVEGVLGGLLTISLDSGTSEIVVLLMWLTPGLLFICLYGLNASVLQCEGRYFLPSAAPVLFNLVWIFGVWALMDRPVTEAIPLLAAVVTMASVAQWLITVPATKRILPTSSGRVSLKSPAMKNLVSALSLGVVGIAASQINSAIDVLFARYASSEGPAYLWYAIRIQQLPIGLFAVAISGALLPALSRALQSDAMDKARELLGHALSWVVCIMVPATFALLTCGAAGVCLLYGRGHFNFSSVIDTSWSLWAYGLGLLPMTLVLILAPAFYAKKDYRAPTKAVLVAVACNMFLNTLCIAVMGFGAASVAFATSLSACVNVWMLLRSRRYWLVSFFPKEWKTLTIKVLCISALAAATAMAAEIWICGSSTAISVLMGSIDLLPRLLADQALHCLASGGAFLAVFAVGMAALSGIPFTLRRPKLAK